MQKKALEDAVLSLQALQDPVIKLNQIHEAHNIKAHSRQESMMFLSAYTVRS